MCSHGLLACGGRPETLALAYLTLYQLPLAITGSESYVWIFDNKDFMFPFGRGYIRVIENLDSDAVPQINKLGMSMAIEISHHTHQFSTQSAKMSLHFFQHQVIKTLPMVLGVGQRLYIYCSTGRHCRSFEASPSFLVRRPYTWVNVSSTLN